MKKYRERRRGLTKAQRRLKKHNILKNKRLVKKYYWLVPRDWYGNPIKRYDYSWIDWGWGKGWDKAFGQMLMDEIGAVVKKCGLKHFTILQTKEKFGSLRMYVGGSCEEIDRIISKYEYISERVCMGCGHEAPMTNNGWMLPRCFKCYLKEYRNREAWALKHKPNTIIKTDEEIREFYNSIICDTPDDDGEFKLPNSYSICRFGEGGKKEITTYDISETSAKIQKRMEKFT